MRDTEADECEKAQPWTLAKDPNHPPQRSNGGNGPGTQRSLWLCLAWPSGYSVNLQALSRSAKASTSVSQQLPGRCQTAILSSWDSPLELV